MEQEKIEIETNEKGENEKGRNERDENKTKALEDQNLEDQTLEELNKEKKVLILNLNKAKKELSESEEKIESLLKKEEQITNSKEYLSLVNLINEQKELGLKIKNTKEKVASIFSGIEKPLRKYQRIIISDADKKIIENYLLHGLNALIDDSNFHIARILNGLLKAISNQEIKLKERTVDKILKQVTKMNQEYFKEFIERYNSMLNRKREIEEEIKKIQETDDKADIKSLDAIKTSIKSNRHLIDSLKLKINLMNKKLESEEEWKKCPNCGEEIPSNWKRHKKCGWAEFEEERREDNENLDGTAEITVFTSPTCPHCHPAVELARQVKRERDNVRVIELSTATPNGYRKAQKMGVMAVPTIFVKGPSSPQIIGFKGAPSKKSLLKAIDISFGKEELEEPKGFFKNLFSRFRKNKEEKDKK